MPSASDISHATNLRTMIICMVIATIFVAVRAVARWRAAHSYNIEDYLCLAALVFFIAYSATYISVLDSIYMFQDLSKGLIEKPADFLQQYNDMLLSVLSIQFMFWFTLWFVKFSLLMMFKRLTERVLPIYNYAWWGAMIFTVLALLTSIVTVLVTCGDMTKYGEAGSCSTDRDKKNQNISLFYSLAVDVITDLLIMAIPISLIWNLQMNIVEKLGIGVAFSAGLATIVAAFIRAFTLAPDADSQVNISWLAFWASIEGCIAVCVNCIPSFAVFARTKIHSSRGHKAGYNSQVGYGHMGSTSAMRRAGGTHGASIALGSMADGDGADDADADAADGGYRKRAEGGRYLASVSAGPNRRGRDIETSSQESIIGTQHAPKDVYVTRTVEIS